MNLTKEELIALRKKVEKITLPGEIEKILEHKTPYQRFKDTAERKPDSIAILYFGNAITYRQMLTLIDNAAKGFQEIGIKYNDVVTTSLLATPYGIVSFYALDKLGAVMHMVNAASNIEEMKRELSGFNSKYFVANDIFYGKKARVALREAGIEKVVTTSLTDSIPLAFNGDRIKYQLIEKLKGVKSNEFNGVNLINFEQLLNIGRNSRRIVKACDFVPNKLTTIAYTSGSTGNCKACGASWERIDSMIQIMGMTEIGRFEEDDIMFTTFPLWIYYCLLNMIHEPLSLGVTLALDPLFNPKDIFKRNEQYRFNHWLTIPPYIKTMIELNKPTETSKWKIVITGGAALDTDIKMKADKYIKENGGNTHVEQGYGANELLGSVAYGYNENPSLGTVGIPCVGNMVKILDVDTGKELGTNETGVAYFYSAARMDGYCGNEEATRHNLVPDENGVIWYNSEDLMHVNERGELFLDGRIRRIALTLDSKGNPTKIIPERTKKGIAGMNEIADCEVITVPDEKIVNKPVAFIVLKKYSDAKGIEEKVIEHCQNNVPEYMVPQEVYILDELPRTTSKKPDLQKLKEMYEDMNKNAKNGGKVRKLFKTIKKR